jgi:hypothetical protein
MGPRQLPYLGAAELSTAGGHLTDKSNDAHQLSRARFPGRTEIGPRSKSTFHCESVSVQPISGLAVAPDSDMIGKWSKELSPANAIRFERRS